MAIDSARVPAQPSASHEYEIKAAFPHNFVKFVEWPSEALPESGDTMTNCALSDDPFAGALEPIKGETVEGRRLVIRRIERGKQAESCHALFVGSTAEHVLTQLVHTLQRSSVLTVGEIDRFVESDGIITFVIEKNEVRFEINVSGAERARLKLSSQLVSLARVVRQ